MTKNLDWSNRSVGSKLLGHTKGCERPRILKRGVPFGEVLGSHEDS